MLSWEDAQRHCQSVNMTLFQYDKAITNANIQRIYYNLAQDFPEFMFMGLRKNKEVCISAASIEKEWCS